MQTGSTAHTTHVSDWIASAFLLPLCAYYILQGEGITILDTLCMLVFDAGRMLGGVIHAPLQHVGGAVLLLALPVMLVWYFSGHGYRFGIQVFLFWLGQDLIFLGRTAIDINGHHPLQLNAYQFDVHSMLSFLELAEASLVIGQTFFMLGVVAFVTLLVLPLYMSR